MEDVGLTGLENSFGKRVFDFLIQAANTTTPKTLQTNDRDGLEGLPGYMDRRIVVPNTAMGKKCIEGVSPLPRERRPHSITSSWASEVKTASSFTSLSQARPAMHADWQTRGYDNYSIRGRISAPVSPR